MYDENFEAHKAKILVVGAGGAGNNTITTLTEKGVKGASTVAINTDAKHLMISKANEKVLIGRNLTKGLGAGGYPDVGKKAAEESKQELRRLLKDIDLVFLTCGLGGGTGTGSAPVVAKIAKEMGAIVIAAVTLPFRLEGARMTKAMEGLDALRQNCDTAIVIENQKLLEVAGKRPLKDAFAVADNLFAGMIKGITETISEPSLVNLDYADVKSIMKGGGLASIGIGSSDSDEKAEEAVLKALNHPLIDVDYSGSKGALVQVIGGNDMKLEEVDLIGKRVQETMSPDSQIIWGARILPEFEGKIQVITIITGVKSPMMVGAPSPQSLSKELGIKMIK